MDLAGVSLWAGSESRRPMILQVISTSATRQKMKQLVPYMIIAGTLNTETGVIRRWESDELKIEVLRTFFTGHVVAILSNRERESETQT